MEKILGWVLRRPFQGLACGGPIERLAGRPVLSRCDHVPVCVGNLEVPQITNWRRGSAHDRCVAARRASCQTRARHRQLSLSLKAAIAPSTRLPRKHGSVCSVFPADHLLTAVDGANRRPPPAFAPMAGQRAGDLSVLSAEPLVTC